jgi:tetratricopeptide (TPR) repeat protein
MVGSLLLLLLWLTVPQLRAYYNYTKTNWRDTAAVLIIASEDPANFIAIDSVWQPYVFYYQPELRDRVRDLPAPSTLETSEEPVRIWYLGARETLAAASPPTWEITTLSPDPAQPIQIASRMPAHEWLPAFMRQPLPPTAYLPGQLYALAAMDPELTWEIGNRLLMSIWNRTNYLTNRQRAELMAMIGRLRFEAGEPDTGLSLLHAAARYDDTSQEALNALGYALMQAGQLREATTVFEQSIWHNPRSYWAYAFLSNIYGSQQNWRKAAEYHVKAWEYAYNPAMKAEQEAAAAAAYAELGDERAREEFKRKVQQAGLAAD